MNIFSKNKKYIETLLESSSCFINEQRQALMGLAAILIFMCHCPSQRLGFVPTGIISTFINNGKLGVDIFLFLSAYGLGHALTKSSLKEYYIKRFWRIIPTWLLVLIAVHIIGLISNHFLPTIEFEYPKTPFEYFTWYTGIGFFINQCHYEWYIPSIMVLYIMTPMLYRMNITQLLLTMFPLGIILPIFLGSCMFLPHLHIITSRLCIFVLGIIFYKCIESKNLILFLTICISSFVFLIICSHILPIPIPLYFCFLCPFFLMGIGKLLCCKSICWLNYCLGVVGSISLEFYLVQLYRRPQFLISLFTSNCYLQIIGAFLLCIFLSYLLQKITSFIVQQAKKHLQQIKSDAIHNRKK